MESSRIEFKADFNPTPVIHTICAFANDIDNIGGGYLVIGVEERDGMPVLPPKGIESERIDGILKRLNCLTKTQGCANSKDDVYSLTPARCRKVKRRCHSQEEALN